MEFWLDTINLKVIKLAIDMGLLFGVTTNPIILSSVQKPPSETLSELLSILPEQSLLAVQVTADSAEGMLQQARQFRAFSNRIIIKVPVTEVGMQAMVAMKKENIPIMATAIVSEKQMLLAVQAGATYAAPYLYAMEKESINYSEELKKMQEIVKQQKSSTKILAASINNVVKINECAEMGIPSVTIPAETFEEFIKTPVLAGKYLMDFKLAWEKSGFKDDKLFRVDSGFSHQEGERGEKRAFFFGQH